MSKLHHSKYFAHIDGIRSLAILPVVFFHLIPASCTGGFLGVDVFFVISGYLICGGIMRQLEKGEFTLKSFYYRRIRRIFPAYFAIVIAVLLAGVLLYHWARLLPLAQTAMFSVAFSTNLYFWLTMGYFQPTSHENPLLHLWSLGIEEQFYIIVPLAMLLLWKIRKNWLMPVIVLTVVLSFIACVALGEFGQSTTAFYILPARAWELLAGALIAGMPAAKPGKGSKLLSIFGALLVLLPFWALGTARTFGDPGTNVELLWLSLDEPFIVPFPGWITIPSILGTVLLIRFGAAGVIGSILSSRFFVWIGKISYSLYLWHWPVFVFGRYISYDAEGVLFSATLLALSFLCAYLSWKYVEMPVRISDTFTMRRAFSSAGVGIGLVSIICISLILSEGMKNGFRSKANHHASAPFPFMPYLKKLTPSPPGFQQVEYPGYDKNHVEWLGDPDAEPSFCLIGDSHGWAIGPGLGEVAAERGKAGYHVITATPMRLFEEWDERQHVLEWVASRKEVTDVYWAGKWLTQYGFEEGIPKLGESGTIGPVEMDAAMQQELEDNFRAAAEFFRSKGKRVHVFSCVPEYGYQPADIMARSKIIPLDVPIAITEQDYRNRQAPVTSAFNKLEVEGLVRLIPLGEAFLSNGTTVVMAPDGSPYYRDSNHIYEAGSSHGAQFIAPMLWP